MKVIHIPRRFSATFWGGTETCILNLARAQQASGTDASIFTSQALCPTPAETMQGVDVRRFTYQYPFLGLTPAQVNGFDQSGGNLLSLPLFKALLKTPDVGLLHAHTGKRLGGIIRTAARLKRIPYVITLHGGQFDIPTAIKDARQEQVPTGFEWGKIPGALLGSRRVLDDAAAIFCVGRGEQRAVASRYPNKRVEYLPNGVDAARFSQTTDTDFRARHQIAAAAELLLCVGRIDPQKNQQLLLQALAHLQVSHPKAHLLLIGHVTDATYASQLHLTIEKLNLAASVTLLPGLAPDNPELVAAYHAADLFCLPSIHEPFGIVILEAWTAGLPVLASKVGGIPGFTHDGEDICHVSRAEAELWARSIGALLDDPTRRQRLAGNGRQQVTACYDWHQVNRQVETVYAEVTAAASAKLQKKSQP
ncbi:MAG: glycosyltransferase family 4 protein [Pseudomonadales bacterium]|nr:glycosyltransferase family 4 protein [Pseudomonadales bacterium]MDP4640869.1 glycosyltransferase family 4 protein [Pseudomonadales bacterium]